jgi:hypothetical protein
MQRPNRPQLPAPLNQLTAHNIKVSLFVTIGKTRLRPYFSTPTVITFGVSFELLLFLTSNVNFF